MYAYVCARIRDSIQEYLEITDTYFIDKRRSRKSEWFAWELYPQNWLLMVKCFDKDNRESLPILFSPEDSQMNMQFVSIFHKILIKVSI